jgi:hypothetical protein
MAMSSVWLMHYGRSFRFIAESNAKKIGLAFLKIPVSFLTQNKAEQEIKTF